MSVIAAAFGCFPETVANLQNLIVLRIGDVFGKRQAPGIMSDHGGHVLLNHILQACAIAVEPYRPCGRVDPGKH